VGALPPGGALGQPGTASHPLESPFLSELKLSVCSWCSSVPVHARRIILPGPTLIGV
jgi:hypothetical protein